MAGFRYAEAQNYLVYELNLLGKILCAICSGYGHTNEDCPTARKLIYFGSATVHSHIMTSALETTINSTPKDCDLWGPPYSELKVPPSDIPSRTVVARSMAALEYIKFPYKRKRNE